MTLLTALMQLNDSIHAAAVDYRTCMTMYTTRDVVRHTPAVYHPGYNYKYKQGLCSLVGLLRNTFLSLEFNPPHKRPFPAETYIFFVGSEQYR